MDIKVKCPYCGQEFLRRAADDGVKWIKNEIEGIGKGRYFHVDCYKKAIEESKELWPAVIASKNIKEKELKAYTDMCYDYLKRELKIDADYLKIQSQLRGFNRNRSMKYEGMYKTLKYYYEIQKGDKTKAEGGVGIIPYKYEEAYAFYSSKSTLAIELNATIMAQIEARANASVKSRTTKQTKKKNKFVLSEADEME